MADPTQENADSGWDNYAERVLRNEGRLHGLEELVKETRHSDTKLLDQRADSLAKELERRAHDLEMLCDERRNADRREFRDAIARVVAAREELRVADQERDQMALQLLREVYDTAIRELDAKIQIALESNMAQSTFTTDALEQKVVAWRESDREARMLQAQEYSRRLDELNHNHMRTQEILRNSVTRDLWAATEESWNQREKADHDKINTLEKQILLLTPMTSSDKAHEVLNNRINETADKIMAQADARMEVLNEKIADLKASRDVTTGKSTGYTALYGWVVAGLGLLLTTIIVANVLFGSR